MKLTYTAILSLAFLPHDSLAMDEEQPRPRNQMVRVVTLSQDGMTENPGRPMLQATLQRMDRAASFRPDIVCLPETFTRGEAETVPGPTTDRIAAWARKHRSYVICPLKVRSDKSVFNPPVFPTDFGTIGIQICFDVNWREQWQSLREQGAQIIFFPSAYPAARQVRSLAWLNQCFVVSSNQTRPASILDVTGETLTTTGKFRHWAGAVLPIGKRLFEIDFHIGKLRHIEQKYGHKVRVEWFHNDDLATLASLNPELTVDDIIAEFKLTPHANYIRRAQQAQDEQRPAGKVIRPPASGSDAIR